MSPSNDLIYDLVIFHRYAFVDITLRFKFKYKFKCNSRRKIYLRRKIQLFFNTSHLLLYIFIPKLPGSALPNSFWIRGVQRATIWVMMRARVIGVDTASHGSEYPYNPIHTSPSSCPTNTVLHGGFSLK